MLPQSPTKSVADMKQLSEGQRYKIEAYLQAGMKKDEIARLVGIHRSTLYRELRRNKWKPTDKYKADYAQYRYELRKSQRERHTKFTIWIEERARVMLEELHYSPEQIVGRCRLLGYPMVSHERLYQWIWKNKRNAGTLYRSLRRQGRKHGKRKNCHKDRGWVKNRTSITERPAIVDRKSRLGDLEIDTMIGKGQKGAILTINDRKSVYLLTCLLPSRDAKYVTAATINLLQPYRGYLHTITSDNGSEFAGHQEIAKALNIKFYFARPYHSWERGANENTNGLIRQFIPKGVSMEDVSGYYLEDITKYINWRPRKRLGFLSPEEAVELPSIDKFLKYKEKWK